MFDIEAFRLNHDYFDCIDYSEPVDMELENNADLLDEIDQELQEVE